MKFAKLFLVIALISAPKLHAAESKPEKANIMANEISKSIDLFFVDCHEVPQKLQDIVKQPKGCKYWGPDPYVKEIPKDPWGRQWRYKRLDPQHYELLSLGADGKEGGEKDNSDVIFKGKAPEIPAQKSK